MQSTIQLQHNLRNFFFTLVREYNNTKSTTYYKTNIRWVLAIPRFAGSVRNGPERRVAANQAKPA
jgi:hypothetical protein